MLTGWLKWNGYWYYLHKLADRGSSWEGKMAQSGWDFSPGRKYYFRTVDNNVAIGDEGAMLESGYWTVGGQWTWFDAEGIDTMTDPKVPLLKGIKASTAEINQLANQAIEYSLGTMHQNCLGFALNRVPRSNKLYGYDWIWPWSGEPTVATMKSWFTSNTTFKRFSATAPSVKPFIIVYGQNGRVAHFARMNSSGSIHAKWGHLQIFKHTTTNPYKPSGGYGQPLFYAY
jgi:hypothetical protein